VTPDAGEAGRAGVSASNVRCITRASQVHLTGQRMSTIRVSVDGRRLGTREIRLLQRRVLPLNRIFSPGRHRLSIRVAFEPGSATASATLTRTIIVCSRATRGPGSPAEPSSSTRDSPHDDHRATHSQQLSPQRQ
jgi:hypothetical protein